jgi:hypothetical protein
MCKVKTPDYTPPPKAPQYARDRKPDNAALYEAAQAQAAQRSGGSQRSTILTGLRGVVGMGGTTQRKSTVLG